MAGVFLSFNRRGGSNWGPNRFNGYVYVNAGNGFSHHRHNDDDREFNEDRFPEEGKDHSHNEYEHLEFMVDRCQSRTTHHMFADNFPKVHTPDTIDALQKTFASTYGDPNRMADFKRTWLSFDKYPIGPRRDAAIANAMDGLITKWGGRVTDQAADLRRGESKDVEVSVNAISDKIPRDKNAAITLNANTIAGTTVDGRRVDFGALGLGKNDSIVYTSEARQEIEALTRKQIKEGNATINRYPDGHKTISYTEEGQRELGETASRELQEGKITIRHNVDVNQPPEPTKEQAEETTSLPPKEAKLNMVAQAKKLFDGDVDGPNDGDALRQIVADMRANGLRAVDAKQITDEIRSNVYGKTTSTQVAEDVLTYQKTGDMQTLRAALLQDLAGDPRASDIPVNRTNDVKAKLGLN